MPDTGERMELVFRKASRIRRQRSRLATPVLGVCAILLGVGVVGSIGLFAGSGSDITIEGLYGSSLMLGSDVGTYVIVALLAAALAVVITLICVNKSRNSAWYDSADALEKDETHE